MKVNFEKMFSKRIGRKHFILGGLLGAAVFYILFFAFAFLTAITYKAIGQIFIGILLIADIIYTLSLDIRRLHDLGKSGWWLLFTFVPLANLVLIGFLLFDRGNLASNKYGEPIQKNAKFFDVIFGQA